MMRTLFHRVVTVSLVLALLTNAAPAAQTTLLFSGEHPTIFYSQALACVPELMHRVPLANAFHGVRLLIARIRRMPELMPLRFGITLPEDSAETIIDPVRTFLRAGDYGAICAAAKSLVQSANPRRYQFLVAIFPMWLLAMSALKIPINQQTDLITPLTQWFEFKREKSIEELMVLLSITDENIILTRLGIALLHWSFSGRFFNQGKYRKAWEMMQQSLRAMPMPPNKRDEPINDIAHLYLTHKAQVTQQAGATAVILWSETGDPTWIEEAAQLYEWCAEAQSQLQNSNAKDAYTIAAIGWLELIPFKSDKASILVKRAEMNRLKSGPLSENARRVLLEGLWAAALQDHPEQALEYFQRAAELEPLFTGYLTRTYLAQGMLQEAAAASARVQEPTVRELYEQGRIYFELQEYAAAGKAWRNLLDETKTSFLVYMNEAVRFHEDALKVYVRLGDIQAANDLCAWLLAHSPITLTQVLMNIKQGTPSYKVELAILRHISGSLKKEDKALLNSRIAELEHLDAPSIQENVVIDWNKLKLNSKVREDHVAQFFRSGHWIHQPAEWKLARLTQWARDWWSKGSQVAKLPKAFPLLIGQIQQILMENPKKVLAGKDPPLLLAPLTDLATMLKAWNTEGSPEFKNVAPVRNESRLLEAIVHTTIALHGWLELYAVLLSDLELLPAMTGDEIQNIREDFASLKRSTPALVRVALKPLLLEPLAALVRLNRQRQQDSRRPRKPIATLKSRIEIFEERVERMTERIEPQSTKTKKPASARAMPRTPAPRLIPPRAIPIKHSKASQALVVRTEVLLPRPGAPLPETERVEANIFFSEKLMETYYPNGGSAGPFPVFAPAREATLRSAVLDLGFTEDHLIDLYATRGSRNTPLDWNDFYTPNDQLTIHRTIESRSTFLSALGLLLPVLAQFSQPQPHPFSFLPQGEISALCGLIGVSMVFWITPILVVGTRGPRAKSWQWAHRFMWLSAAVALLLGGALDAWVLENTVTSLIEIPSEVLPNGSLVLQMALLHMGSLFSFYNLYELDKKVIRSHWAKPKIFLQLAGATMLLWIGMGWYAWVWIQDSVYPVSRARPLVLTSA